MDNLTPEQRQRSADARRGAKRTPEQRARIAEGTKKAWAEGKMDSLRGRKRPDEVRDKVSKGLVLAYKEGRLKASGCYKNKWQVYDGIQGRINMRSQSEVLLAQKLDEHKIAWEYEPRRFDLGWCTYMPDFYLPDRDVWIEVKAWLTENSAKKIDDFIRMGYHLVVITFNEVRAAGLPSELKEVTSSGV